MSTESNPVQEPVIDTADDRRPVQNNGKRKRMISVVTTVLVVVLIVFTLLWQFVFAMRERTDDAYVGGTQVTLTSQIPGTVVAVLAEEHQLVNAGQVLAMLDAIDAQTALDKASSALALSVRQFRQVNEQAGQFDAAVVSRRLDLLRAKEDLKHREPLAANEAIAMEELRHAREAVSQAEAALQQAEHQSRAAHALVDGSNVRNNPSVLQAKQVFIDAWLALQRTSIIAPISGHVAQKALQPGQHVQPGQSLLSIIPLGTVWVDANFKENQLRNLRIGQPVEVKSDLYGNDSIFHGKVSGIAAGTGAAFALLPAQNASGNWIKVIQRVPVRITLDQKEVEQHPLRVGLSTEVTVDTHDRSGAVLPPIAGSGFKAETSVYALDLSQAESQADAIIAKQL